MSFSKVTRISQRLWTKYQEVLDRRPLQTQIATTAVLWTIGDFSAQRIAGSKDLDLRRTALTAGYAASFIGPAGHFWYLGLDSAVVRLGLGSASLAGVASKVAADTLIFGPVHIVAFFAFMEAVEGRGLVAAADKIRSDFWPTFLVELGFWPAFQALNFWKVPVRHQLLAVNAACVLDSTFLCWARGQERWSESLMQKLGITMPPSGSSSSSLPSSSAPAPEDVINDDTGAKLKKGP